MTTSYLWMFCEALHLHIALVVVSSNNIIVNFYSAFNSLCGQLKDQIFVHGEHLTFIFKITTTAISIFLRGAVHKF